MVYVDSSVIIRILFGEPGALDSFGSIKDAVTSNITEVECLRALDRLRIANNLSDEAVTVRREALFRLLEGIEKAELSGTVLRRAGEPFPVALATRAALHVATAVLLREERGEDLKLATHDASMGRAARSLGIEVIGL
jgi:predicted nucleic acid-binding protein